MIGSFLNWIGSFFQNLFQVTFRFLGDLFGSLFNGLFTLLRTLFSPVLILLAMIFYFLYQLGVLVVKLIAVILGVGKILFSLVKGIIATMAGFSWTPSTPNHGGQWVSIFSHMSEGLDNFQLQNVAYVLHFMIWIATAFAAIKIIGSMSGGAEDN